MPNTQLMALDSEYLTSRVICTCQHDIRGNAFLVVHVAATCLLPPWNLLQSSKARPLELLAVLRTSASNQEPSMISVNCPPFAKV